MNNHSPIKNKATRLRLLDPELEPLTPDVRICSILTMHPRINAVVL